MSIKKQKSTETFDAPNMNGFCCYFLWIVRKNDKDVED